MSIYTAQITRAQKHYLHTPLSRNLEHHFTKYCYRDMKRIREKISIEVNQKFAIKKDASEKECMLWFWKLTAVFHRCEQQLKPQWYLKITSSIVSCIMLGHLEFNIHYLSCAIQYLCMIETAPIAEWERPAMPLCIYGKLLVLLHQKFVHQTVLYFISKILKILNVPSAT